MNFTVSATFERPLFKRLYWKKIDVLDGLATSSKIVKDAKEVAENHPSPELPAFLFTESNPKWVLLYNLARKGQITPRIMRNMKRSDLYFLAGHTFPHPGLTQPRSSDSKGTMYAVWSLDNSESKWEQATKLQGNATRAKNELDRRNFVWTSFLVVLAALAGGLFGSGIWK